MNADRKIFEDWYILSAFDLEANPIGSRQCGLQWKAWQAALWSHIPAVAEESAKWRPSKEQLSDARQDVHKATECYKRLRRNREPLDDALKSLDQACVDNFLPTTAHPTFKDGLLRKIEQYFAPLFASPAPADGWVKMDNPDYAQYLRKDWVMVPREPTQAMLDAGFYSHPTGKPDDIPGPRDVYKAMIAAAPKVAE